MTTNEIVLRCPYCGGLCKRSVGFVRAKFSFVCDRCREIARIDKADAETVLAPSAIAYGARTAVEGRKISL
jgi:hypothetical protein